MLPRKDNFVILSKPAKSPRQGELARNKYQPIIFLSKGGR